MQNYDTVGISFPRSLLQQIDEERGDISRSRFLLRVLEKDLQNGEAYQGLHSVETREANGGESNG